MIRKPRSLRAQLDAYEATSRHHAEAGKARQRRWSAFATAAGSGLALATAADADIIYSGIKDLTATAVTNKGGGRIFIDMDGNNFIGVISRHAGSSTWADAALQGTANITSRFSALRNGSDQLKMLVSGAKISSGAGAFKTQGYLRSSFRTGEGAGAHGTWPRSQPGFAGVRFTQDGSFHFGWIQLEWTGSDFAGLESPAPKTITAIDWAYQSDPDTPILAGAGIPPSVPEPNTAMIAFLASGCAGVLALRQRRRRRDAEAQAANSEAIRDLQPG